jgi:predicted nucleotidyltransferase
MTNISHNLVGKIDRKTVSILSDIDQSTEKLKIPFFIVGAFARDILLQYAYGIHTPRATLDIDFSIFITDWAQFDGLKTVLLRAGKFHPTKQTQRLLYEKEYPVDIVPFGGIANEDGSISWPPEHAIEMNTAGFQECYKHAISIQVKSNPDLIVKVVSLAGLAILKIIAWEDGMERRGKDAVDLFCIIKNYIEAGNMERFFEEEGDILKKEESDYDRASAHFLGRDMARLTEPRTKASLIQILKRQTNSSHGHKIAMDVLKQDVFQEITYEKITAYFVALLRGLID